jgi:hypothetical protein
MYCVGRYVSDIGVRRDVVKVPVKTLVAQATPPAMEGEVAEQSKLPRLLAEKPSHPLQ